MQMTAPRPPPPSTAAALAVLGDHALLVHIVSFQRGLSSFFLQLRRDYVAKSTEMQGLGTAAALWWAVLADGELRHVQSLYRMRSLPEVYDAKFLHVKDIAQLAVSLRRVDVLKWFNTVDRETPWSGDLLYRAANKKHPEMVRWLMANRPEACVEARDGAMVSAAVQGELELLKELLHRWPEALTPSVMDTAAWTGNLEAVTYLHEKVNAPCTTRAMDRAALQGHFDVVRFLHENRTEGCTTSAMDCAANKSLGLVKFLHERRSEGCSTSAMDFAAKSGRLDIVRFLHENRTEGCTTQAMRYAAINGHLDVVKFLHEHRPDVCTEHVVAEAAREGHLEVVKYLHQSLNQWWVEPVMPDVLLKGDLEMVKYLHEHMNVKFTPFWLRQAAKTKGDGKIIEYVRDRVPKNSLSSACW